MTQYTPSGGRITHIHVQGLRTLTDIHLRVEPLTVLIGDNGSGKSTIIEACEILRRASGSQFLQEFISIHDGLEALRNSNTVHLGASFEAGEESFDYEVQIEDLAGLAITKERLIVRSRQGENIEILSRNGRSGKFMDAESGEQLNIRVPGDALLLTGFGLRVPHPAIRKVIGFLQRIDVHLPFPTLPTWVTRSVQPSVPTLRVSRPNQPVDSLSRLGTNLANIYSELRRDPIQWGITMDYVRLGLGEDIEDILVRRNASQDLLEIWMKYKYFDPPVPARSLSDGTLDYLAFVALFRTTAQRSLLAFDEPEAQLHPLMAKRVAQFLESLSSDFPILIATHSDRLLDSLSDPASSVVLCKLNTRRHTELVRPNPAALAAWLRQYRGLGEIRSAGHENSVMTKFSEGSE